MQRLFLLCCLLMLSACGIKGGLVMPTAPGASQSTPAASANPAP